MNHEPKKLSDELDEIYNEILKLHNGIISEYQAEKERLKGLLRLAKIQIEVYEPQIPQGMKNPHIKRFIKDIEKALEE